MRTTHLRCTYCKIPVQIIWDDEIINTFDDDEADMDSLEGTLDEYETRYCPFCGEESLEEE